MVKQIWEVKNKKNTKSRGLENNEVIVSGDLFVFLFKNLDPKICAYYATLCNNIIQQQTTKHVLWRVPLFWIGQ